MNATDITLEAIRAFLVLCICVYMLRTGKKRFRAATGGWDFIVWGFLLLLFGSLLDITDNFDSLNKFVIIGDTEPQAILEKVVGYLGGFLLLAIGFVKWVPNVGALSDEILERRKAQEALKQAHDNLEDEVRERTIELTEKIETIRSYNQSINDDLELARDFQTGLLSKINETPYLKIATIYEPKELVSGDVYAIYYNRERELNIFLGDATGHGVASAFMTMMVHIGLDHIRADLAPSKTLKLLNENLSSHILGYMFLTGVFVRIDQNGLLKTSRAGHPPIIIVPNNGREPVVLRDGGFPIAMFHGKRAEFPEEHFQLGIGDMVLLYTDGVTEWENGNHQQYGAERLTKALEDCRDMEMESRLKFILNDVETFAEGNVREDDITMICVQYTG